MSGTVDEIRTNFIERMGLLAQGDGLSRSAGRVFALLVFDGTPIAFGDIAEMLQLSRASVSTSVRQLEERGLAKRSTRPGERQEYFETSPDAFLTMLNAARGRIENVRTEIESTVAALPASAAGPRERLDEYSGLYRAISDGLEVAIERLKQRAMT